jgi:hypothetical protein
MTAIARPFSYTEVEVRSYLPSGWGIVSGAVGRWNVADARWSVDVYDGADHVWQLDVPAAEVERSDRFAALKAGIRKLDRKALGRKSVITG